MNCIVKCVTRDKATERDVAVVHWFLQRDWLSMHVPIVCVAMSGSVCDWHAWSVPEHQRSSVSATDLKITG